MVTLQEMQDDLEELEASKMPESLKKGRRAKLVRWIAELEGEQARKEALHARSVNANALKKSLEAQVDDLQFEVDSKRSSGWLMTAIVLLIVILTIVAVSK